jgi:tRNA threonylcarbamoyladenosine biosynthesis protein TsaE
MRRLSAAVIALIATLGAGVPGARAHPHVWVDAMTVLGFEAGALSHLRVRWTFDPFFSSVLFTDFDRDDSGDFDPAEIDAMRAGAFQGLSEVAFFTDLRIGGERVDWEGFRDFGIDIAEDGTVTYAFTLDLPAPAPVAGRDVTLSLYDPDFYVAITAIEDRPLRFLGAGSEDCGADWEEATDNKIYFGLVTPDRAVLTCPEASG